MNDALRLVVQDALGRMVHEEQMDGSMHQLSVSLAPSLYYIHLTNGARWLAGAKLVVE